MKPFAYEAPSTVEGAVALLAEPARAARPLAGGTDLLVQLRYGQLALDLVVDVKKIPALNEIAYRAGEGLTLGAAVSCARLSEDEDVQATYPGLLDGAAIIGGTAIQERATVGGNLCNAAPSGDAICPLIVLDATALVAGPQGTRRVPVADFCIAPRTTVLQPGELLVSLHVPPPQARSGAAYLRFTPRKEMDIAVAGAAAWLQLDEAGRISAARIALAAVAPRPLPVPAAAEVLVGQTPDEGAFAAAAQAAQEAALPITDVRGTLPQRRHLVGVLVKRALQRALARANEEELS